MRVTALIGVAVIVAACSSKEAPPAADTTAMAPAEPAAASVSGLWNVNVMPVGKDTVVTSYVLDANDPSAWKFVFTGRTDTIPMRRTGQSGDTLLTEAGPFQSGIRQGQQVSVKNKSWMENGQIMMTVDAHYEGTPADSIVRLRAVGTKQ
jgi:hypothetical protein